MASASRYHEIGRSDKVSKDPSYSWSVKIFCVIVRVWSVTIFFAEKCQLLPTMSSSPSFKSNTILPSQPIASGVSRETSINDQIGSATHLMQGASLTRSGDVDNQTILRNILLPPPVSGEPNWGIPSAPVENCMPELQVKRSSIFDSVLFLTNIIIEQTRPFSRTQAPRKAFQ
jgi:hypothetical protein